VLSLHEIDQVEFVRLADHLAGHEAESGGHGDADSVDLDRQGEIFLCV
jgi:hypothetical protein